jgi:hypothetical protein
MRAKDPRTVKIASAPVNKEAKFSVPTSPAHCSERKLLSSPADIRAPLQSKPAAQR